MNTNILSTLDRDLGLERPCDLNLFWAAAARAGNLTGKYSVNNLLRLRYTSGGWEARSYREIAATLKINEEYAHKLVTRALTVMLHPERKRLYAPTNKAQRQRQSISRK